MVKETNSKENDNTNCVTIVMCGYKKTELKFKIIYVGRAG